MVSVPLDGINLYLRPLDAEDCHAVVSCSFLELCLLQLGVAQYALRFTKVPNALDFFLELFSIHDS